MILHFFFPFKVFFYFIYANFGFECHREQCRLSLGEVVIDYIFLFESYFYFYIWFSVNLLGQTFVGNYDISLEYIA